MSKMASVVALGNWECPRCHLGLTVVYNSLDGDYFCLLCARRFNVKEEVGDAEDADTILED